MSTSTKLQINETFIPLLEAKERTLLLVGSAGSGKSKFVAQKLVKDCLESTHKVLATRKVASTIRESVYDDLITALYDFGVYDDVEVVASRFEINFPNGSKIICKGMDDPKKLKSITDLSRIWMEELTEFDREDYSQLELRLRHPVRHNQIILSTNPDTRSNWVYTTFIENIDKLEDFMHHRSSYKDNVFLPKSYLDSIERQRITNPIYYKIYAECKWVSLDKAIYNNWEVKEFDHKEVKRAGLSVMDRIWLAERGLPRECDDWKEVHGGDFGFSQDPATVISLLVNMRKKEIYIYDEIYERGLVNEELAKRIQKKGLGRSLITFDSSEPKSIKELKLLGLKIQGARKGPDSIKYGIQFLQGFKMYVHPRCENTIDELENYSWKKDKKTGEYTFKPEDRWNHLCDAMRYATEGLRRGGKLRTMSKSKLGL
ncbi:PBSX family phage terminase large subunit [Bacillus cereus]|nr:PBSX family phage terminase large subunit [Bacillus cereus]PGU50710.1 PBSX family phage terminase large subunit [Bacillus cereus]